MGSISTAGFLTVTKAGTFIVHVYTAATGSSEPTATSCPFTDVTKDAYYTNAVLWAVSKNRK